MPPASPPAPGFATPPATGTGDELRAVLNRLRRAQGQLAGVLRMVEDARDVESVLQQLKAVGGALDRAGFALVASEMRRGAGGIDDAEVARLEKLVLSLS